jgi:serine phosphatase RsbU (regulator of sigma subunit)
MAERRSTEDRLARWIEPIIEHSLLGGLGPVVLRELLERAEFDRLTAGQVLIRQGETGQSAYLVLAGELDVIVETPLGDVTMATLGPLQIVGEIAIFTRLPRTATVRARASSTLMRINGRDFEAVISTHPETALTILAALGRTVASLNGPLAMLTRAAQALEQSDIDTEALADLVSGSDESNPFAQSFRKLLREMEGKQSRRQEMMVAARLQQSILPNRLDFASREAPFAIEAMMRAARDVGGDFYDFFFTEDGKRAVLLVADVSGKGVPAALFMAVSRTLFRASALVAPSIEIALERANAQIEAENPECLFVTVFIGELDLESGRLTYVNAGHCDGYVIREDGSLTELPATAPAIGLMPSPNFHSESVTLHPGDVVMLISDGVTEAFSKSGDMFGESRLATLLAHSPGRDVARVVTRVDQAVTEFASGCDQSDDITCLALLHL